MTPKHDNLSTPAAKGGVYIHVPFCARKCSYCAFYSMRPDAELVWRYVEALEREMAGAAEWFHPKTLFFGGGTPSFLNEAQWGRLIDLIHRLGWHKVEEWTVECNPATLSSAKARLLHDGGVTRVSLGVQSLDDDLLAGLGRIHTTAMVYRAHTWLREAGFQNLNLDFMFALPGQTMQSWQSTLAEGMRLGCEHLSCYEVIYEEDTPLFERLRAGEFEPDEDLACSMYEYLLEEAEAGGFTQYEVANFARGESPPQTLVPAMACRHNVNYWRGGDYVGIGPSAAGYFDGVRRCNVADIRRYCDAVARGESTAATIDRLSPRGRAGEIAAFGLRMTAGWDYSEFRRLTGFDLRTEWTTSIRRLARSGWAVDDGHRFRLTREGIRFADAAAQEFLELPSPVTTAAT